eukprot:158306-Rhodomonas_salina.1
MVDTRSTIARNHDRAQAQFCMRAERNNTNIPSNSYTEISGSGILRTPAYCPVPSPPTNIC